MLFLFSLFGKNPGWVTDCYGNNDFSEDYFCGQLVDIPVLQNFREGVIFIFPLYLCEDCDIIRDVINTCDDTFYNLSAYMCD